MLCYKTRAVSSRSKQQLNDLSKRYFVRAIESLFPDHYVCIVNIPSLLLWCIYGCYRDKMVEKPGCNCDVLLIHTYLLL